MENLTMTDQDTSYGVEHEIRISLIGRTGSGKSATGNNILGKKVFLSKLSGSSVTKKCEFHTAERFGKKLVVVDTPGLFDTELSNDDVTKEIIKCIGILTPGPHAFILVVQVGRFTPEEHDSVKHFSSVFGEDFFRYLIVLFTRKDDLENDEKTILDYVKDVPKELKYILRRCGHNYLAFDNSPRGRKDGKDVQELVRLIQAIMKKTGQSCFSNEMFEKAELEFQRRAKEIRLREEEKIAQQQKKIKEEMEAHQKEIERQRKELEEKRMEMQAKELEFKRNAMENNEQLRLKDVAKKAIEAKKREIEDREIERAKYEMRKKHELEEYAGRMKEEIKNMRDAERRRYESEKIKPQFVPQTPPCTIL